MQPAALVVTGTGGVVATDTSSWRIRGDLMHVAAAVVELDAATGPRWVWWSARAVLPALLAAAPGLRLRRCWEHAG